MSRDTRFDWLICRFSARSRRNARRELRAATHRRLRHEPLEDRRLLAVVTVTTLADSVDLADGKLSLREAIFATNTVPGPDTVEFDPALSAAGPATILLTQGEMAITDALTIAGPGAALLTIDASGNDTNPATPGNGSRIFNIDNHAVSVVDVTLSGITLTGGDTNATGGAILSREHLSVDGMVFTGNRAQSGGAIAQLQSSALIANSTFESNGAASDGGAVLVDSLAAGATVTVSANHFTSNSAMRGGAIATRPPGGNAVLVIDGNTIVANNATGQGGGIALPQGPLLRVAIQSSTISGNTAGSQGGGVFAIGAGLGDRRFQHLEQSQRTGRTPWRWWNWRRSLPRYFGRFYHGQHDCRK